VSRVAKRTAAGIVKTRNEGQMKRKSIKIFVTLPPLFTSNSISFNILSMRRIMVKMARPIRKIGTISLKI